MKSKPILVKLIKSYGNKYVIKFPKVIITVDRYYYTKISNSPEEYKFI
ncbi:hypothetical protein [Tenacibaculum sp. M341]|nr:hypothetical protein [Tenacibaculum sp. M341]